MKFHSTIVQVYLYGNWPVGFIKYFGFIFRKLIWELWKSKTCNYCLLPVIRLLWKYCLGRNSFQIFQVDHFSEKNLYISADLCNPCIIMYEILYITLLWYVLQLLYFICCAQISKTITWAYFSNYLSNYQETNCYFYQKLIVQSCYIT